MINLITIDGSGRKVARPVTNREDYLAQRNAPENVQNFLSARGGDKKAKARQVQYNYNDLLPDGVLKGCHHVASTFAHDIDCQSAKEQERIKQVLLEKKDAIGLLELSGSANYGLHAVCRRERGKTILENQVRLSMLTETEMDTSTHDEQRILYTGPATPDNLFYLDDAIFEEQLSPEEAAEEFLQLKERERQGQEEVPPGAKKANKHFKPWRTQSVGADSRVCPNNSETPSNNGGQTQRAPLSSPGGDTNASSADTNAIEAPSGAVGGATSGAVGGAPVSAPTREGYPKDYHGIPFDEILRKYWEVNNNGFEPTEGDRDTLTFQLASDLRHICGRSFEWLDQVIPCYDNFPLDEKRQKIRNALQSKYEGMPQRLRDTLAALRVPYGATSTDGIEAPSGAVGGALGDEGGAVAPEMPRKLPKLIQLLTSKTPDIYKPTLAHALFPPLATHLCGVRFPYTDNVEHEATLMNCLMASTGAGKGCIDEPIRRIMADIKRRDDENAQREAEWKKDCQRKGANKDRMVRPEGLVIQIIDPDMTKPALVTRMDEAEGHFVYVKLNELDLFEQLKGQTGKQHFQLMCLAFDPGAEYGQTRVGIQSVTARPVCRFNWNACTTILKGRRFFNKVLTDGPISRINFCTIPEMEIGAEQPVYGQYDIAFDEALRPYIENLTKARGLIVCKQADALARRLQKECAEFARLSQNEVYWNLSHRACVIAWLKACVLYVANGCKWEKAIDDFIRWSLEYDLWCKMEFFGEDIAKANMETETRTKPGPRNLLELLPDVFTIADARRVRQQQGMGNENRKCEKMIHQWVFRKYVLQITDYSFKKCQ